MPPSSPLPPLSVRALDPNRTTTFDLSADAATCRSLARQIGVTDLRKLRFTGTLTPTGKTDWLLSARLGATIEQPCVATLAPVVTRIDDIIERRFLAQMPETESDPGEDGSEILQDDTIEPLGPEIDPFGVMVEALTLGVPLYPRAPQGEAVSHQVAPPGVTPLRDEDTKPFAGLASLRDKLEKKS